MAFRRSGVYLGWVGYQNLGDEAMWHVCQKRFSAIQWSTMSDVTAPIGVGAVGHAIRDAAWLRQVVREELHDAARLRLLSRKWMHRVASALAGEVGILGGGTLINRNQAVLDAYVQLRKRLNRPVPVFGTGVANREYWSQTDGWVDHRKAWAELLGELPIIGVRGPHSKSALEDAGLKNVVISGDPAVMLHEPLGTRQPSAGSLTIAVNFGEPAGGMIGSAEKLEVQLAEVLRAVRAKYRIKFLPVWPNDVAACTRLALRAGLSELDVTPPCGTHEKFREEVRDVDFLIAFKLHAGILAAAYNVPFVLFEYQPKCRDFLASVDWERFCVKPDKFHSDFLLEQIDYVDRHGPELRREICGQMCRLARNFEEYCVRIAPLLMD